MILIKICRKCKKHKIVKYDNTYRDQQIKKRYEGYMCKCKK